MPLYSPALDLIINRGDKSASGLLSLLGSRVVSSPSSAGAASHRIIAGDQGNCRIRLCTPNLTGERAFDDVDLSTATVRVALGRPGENPYCLATIATPFPVAAAQITTPQSATADLPATKRITLDPPPYGGSIIVTVDDNAPFEIPFDADAIEIFAKTPALRYSIRKRGTNAWEISGTEPNQDVTITVDVSGLLVPSGVSGRVILNTNELAAAFAAEGSPKWLKLTREVQVQFPGEALPHIYQGTVEIARALLNLSSLVPVPLPPSDVASLTGLIAGKQPINSGLTAIAALATTSWARFLLTLSDAGALRTYASAQPLSAQLTALAAIVGAVYGRNLLTASSAGAAKTMLVLDEVDNTADADKPVSTAQAAADTAVADAASADLSAAIDTLVSVLAVKVNNTGAETIAGVKTFSSAPVVPSGSFAESAVQNLVSDLAAKAPLASPALTGTPTAPTAVNATSSTQLATTAFVHALVTDLLNASPSTLDTLKELADAIGDDPNFAVTVANSVATKLAKAANLSDLTDINAARATLLVGNVTNTSDVNKPVSTAQAAADAVITAALNAHAALTDNPHAVTKAQLDLGSADNTADAAKPISALQQAALDLKAALAGNNAFTGANSFYSIAANSILANVLATPAAPTVTPIGSDEGVTRSYRIVAKLADGTYTAAGPAGTNAHGDQTLDATNRISLSWTAIPGAASYDVYRTVAGGISPATTGKIANVSTNAYVDIGAAGDGATSPIRNTTGRTTGALADKGGQVYDVSAYGATPNDSTAAAANLAIINAIIIEIDAAGGAGTIYFPAAYWYISDLFLLTGEGKNIKGAGRESTVIYVANSAACAIQAGSSGVFVSGKISNLSINRVGTPPSGSIGINALRYSNLVLEDVTISNQDVGLKTANSSIGLYLNRCCIFNCPTKNLWLNDSAGTFIKDCDFGRNGSATAPSEAFILFEGSTNDVRIAHTQFLGRAFPNTTAAFKWKNIPSDNPGFYRFVDINTENIDVVFRSESSALVIADFQITGSRLTVNGKLADFHASTAINTFELSHCPNIAFSTATTLTGVGGGVFMANHVSGALFFAGGSWTVIGNFFTTDLTCAGAFSATTVIGNTFAFNGSSPISLITSGATGNITTVGNVADAGTQPPSTFPGGISGKLKGTTAIACCAYRSTDLSVPNSTLTAIPMDIERWDTDGMHSTSSNTPRFTCVTPGWYSISGKLRFAANSTGLRKAFIYFSASGSGSYPAPQSVNASGTSNPIDISVPLAGWYMDAGDYLELHAFQDSGGALIVEAATGHPAQLSIVRNA